jgi:hypothetical protein
MTPCGLVEICRRFADGYSYYATVYFHVKFQPLFIKLRHVMCQQFVSQFALNYVSSLEIMSQGGAAKCYSLVYVGLD